ncbi:rhodanese-like domain-containing protein [Novosphingobium sp.]|uniref:rhodanese-like domain-containing protein n=1 Tax=Novosphingobium sp. TaxID=1874826 RepID=UPI0026224C25|nr:rhodanese-like domain-containing protein [Novosphingobium sp.]
MALAAGAGLTLGAGRRAWGQDAAESLFDAKGYRRTRYRAPVDRDPAPAGTLPLARALRLRPGRDSLFLDVLPADGARRDPSSGAWLGVPPHQTIPGAQWLPETGRASPDPALWSGLTETVRATRSAHPRWPVVVFCRADCWMSWNAARRLAAAGFAGVWWQPEGIDGWHEAGRSLVPAVPMATLPRG